MAADQPFERGDTSFIFLNQIGSTRIVVEGAGLVLLDPNADQVARNVMGVLTDLPAAKKKAA